MNGEINKINDDLERGGFAKIILLAIGAIIIILFTYFYLLKPDVEVVAPTPESPKLFGDLTQVIDINQIPGNLPKDLPFEKDVPLLRNEMVYFSNTGEIHSIRSYYSNLPMDTIFSTFKKYFDLNNWKPLATVNDTNNKFLLVMKDAANGTIQLNISKNQIDGRVLVEVIKVDRSVNPEVPKTSSN